MADGRIALLNAGTQEIRFYSDDGTWLSSVGGRGRGPGEFNSAGDLMLGPGDTLYVLRSASPT